MRPCEQHFLPLSFYVRSTTIRALMLKLFWCIMTEVEYAGRRDDGQLEPIGYKKDYELEHVRKGT